MGKINRNRKNNRSFIVIREKNYLSSLCFLQQHGQQNKQQGKQQQNQHFLQHGQQLQHSAISFLQQQHQINNSNSISSRMNKAIPRIIHHNSRPPELSRRKVKVIGIVLQILKAKPLTFVTPLNKKKIFHS